VRLSWRRIGVVFGIGFVIATLAACSDGMHDIRGATPSERPSVATSAAAPEPRTPATMPSDIAPVTRPANATDDAMQWFARVPGSPNPVLLGVRRSATPRPHPTLLVVDASGGLNPDYVAFAEEFVARGFDVAVGCLFSADPTVAPPVPLIACAGAPPLMGVVDAAVPDLDGIVDAAYDVLGASTPLGIVGFSRGAGIAALRATEGGREPVILVSGKYEGWSTLGAVPGGEVNILDRIAGWGPPALVLHGTADGAIPVSQAYDFEAALRAAGASVDAHYYEGSGHNLAGEPEVHADLEGRISTFLCAHMVCAA
jgi:dienelactone hydrolase